MYYARRKKLNYEWLKMHVCRSAHKHVLEKVSTCQLQKYEIMHSSSSVLNKTSEILLLLWICGALKRSVLATDLIRSTLIFLVLEDKNPNE